MSAQLSHQDRSWALCCVWKSLDTLNSDVLKYLLKSPYNNKGQILQGSVTNPRAKPNSSQWTALLQGSAVWVLGEAGAGELTLWGAGWEWWLWLPLFSHVVCWNLDYSRRTEARLVCSTVPNQSFSERPAQTFHWQKECTEVPVQRGHHWSYQLCPQTRALLITSQENFLGLPFSHSAEFFSFSFLRLLNPLPPIAEHLIRYQVTAGWK